MSTTRAVERWIGTALLRQERRGPAARHGSRPGSARLVALLRSFRCGNAAVAVGWTNEPAGGGASQQVWWPSDSSVNAAGAWTAQGVEDSGGQTIKAARHRLCAKEK